MKTNESTISEFSQDGEHYSTSADPMFDENGKIIALAHTVTNITKQKRTDNEIKSKVDELERYKKATIDRELKMVELKKEIRMLKEKQRDVKIGGGIP